MGRFDLKRVVRRFYYELALSSGITFAAVAGGGLIATNASAAVPEVKDEQFLEQAYGNSKYISIATGTQQLIHNAPATATIITRNDIDALGALYLEDVLETVPGLHVTHSSSNFPPVYQIRGLTAQVNRQVLILLDGLPTRQYYLADQGRSGGGFPLHGVQRIEIIRGPGSALHGADAFSGVINIVTKGIDSQSAEINFNVGSFNRKGVNGGFTLEAGRLNGAINLGYEEVGASGVKIRADQQSISDQLLGTSASLAPGEFDDAMKVLDLYLKLEFDGWELNTSILDRSEVGLGAGVGGSLNSEGDSSTTRYTAQVSKDFLNVSAGLDVGLKFSYVGYNEFARFFIVPKGAAVPTPEGLVFLPDGLYSEPEFKEAHLKSDIDFTYSGWSKHQVKVGVGVEQGKLFDSAERRNYDNQFRPLAELTVFENEQAFIEEEQRVSRYLFLQDEWNLAADWTLTSGIRWDDYSDFGTTVNPRLALVWQLDYDFTAKFLYGRAFRAPSLAELFLKDNPILVGNKDLEPEELETLEFGLSYLGLPFYELAVNVFYYKTDKLIQETQNTTTNLNSSSGRGLEMEAVYYANSVVSLEGNYSYQTSSVVDTAESFGGAPEHQAYVRADFKINGHWNVSVDANWVSSQAIVVANPKFGFPSEKDKLDAFSSANININYLFGSKYRVGLNVRNLLNSKRVDATDLTGLLPDHLPLVGRTFVASFSAQI